MQPQLLHRLDVLIREGTAVVSSIPDRSHWVSDKITAQAWLTSASNFVHQVTAPQSYFRKDLATIKADPQLVGGITSSAIQKVLGLIISLKAESEAGLLVPLEYRIVADAFDDFLEHADAFHRSGKLKEAAILGSAVLEDTLKRVAAKNEVPADGLSLEPLIDTLVAADVLKPVQAKRLKTQAGVRNHAFHAEWEQLTLRDVGLMIIAVRDLLADHLE